MSPQAKGSLERRSRPRLSVRIFPLALQSLHIIQSREHLNSSFWLRLRRAVTLACGSIVFQPSDGAHGVTRPTQDTSGMEKRSFLSVRQGGSAIVRVSVLRLRSPSGRAGGFPPGQSQCLRVGSECGFVNFLALVGRQAQCMTSAPRFGQFDRGFVDLVAGHFLNAFGGLRFLSHRNPHVRVEQIGALRRGFHVPGNADLAPGPVEQPGFGLGTSLGAGDAATRSRAWRR